jgi:predicted transcriptional regulator
MQCQTDIFKYTLDIAFCVLYAGIKSTKGVLIMYELHFNAEYLRVTMWKINLSQIRLAQLSGIHRNTISNILQGKDADLETVAAITNGLNVAMQESGHESIEPHDLLNAVYTERIEQPEPA